MLGFIPWGAIVSMMLVIAGLTITAIKGKAAGDTATALLAAAESSKSGVFPKAVEVYNASWVVTLGLAGGCIAVILLTASARLVQKLRKAGKSSKGARGDQQGGWLWQPRKGIRRVPCAGPAGSRHDPTQTAAAMRRQVGAVLLWLPALRVRPGPGLCPPLHRLVPGQPDVPGHLG